MTFFNQKSDDKHLFIRGKVANMLAPVVTSARSEQSNISLDVLDKLRVLVRPIRKS